MLCSRCGAENREGRRFCAECGTSLALACSACGFSNEAGEKFCGGCGAPLLAAATVASPKFGSPESYTPKHLAERILTSKSALEGERKQVTVLFADLKGSMELLADRDAEVARKILDPVLELMMEAVHRYEGTVNQVMGDGIMALFGAPLAHEDHAVRACYAALRMQEAVRRHAEGARREQGVTIRIRMGLNSGEVVVRAIGSDLHMDYRLHLDVALGQRQCRGRDHDRTGIGDLLHAGCEMRRLPDGGVKGLADAVEVYEVTGVGPARTKLQAAAHRGLTRFVGRDAEVDQLRHALDRAAVGHGQVVAIVGEAGVGKSRLCYEFTHSPRVQGWLILQSGSVSYGKATAYLPVIDLLKGYFKIQDRDDQREFRDKVISRVLGLDRSLEPLLPPVLALLDVPVDDPGWAALDPPQRRQRTLDAVKRLLLRESQVQPLMLVIEDLHWIDSETQALLDSLVDSLGSIRMLLLVDYRPEYEHRWGKKTYYTQLRLESLPPERTGELLHALLGETPGLERLKQMLRRRGNPFFLEETVRTLVETKALEGERGAYRLVRPVQNLQIPATVQAILAARIDRLPMEDKQLLQTASVIGKDVPSPILTAIGGLPEEALRRALGHLQDAEFLYETTLFPDLEYTFKHALTHEVTYGSLLQDRRRALHGQIVETIERLYPDRLAEHVDRLAHHAFRAEAWEKAVIYLRQAGAKAFARSAYREALASIEQALTVLQQLPESRELMELAVDLRLEARNSLVLLGELEGILPYLRDAEHQATLLGDQERLGWVSVFMSNYLWQIGAMTEARECAEKARAIGKTLGDLLIQSAGDLNRGFVCQTAGDLRGAEASSREIIQSLKGDLMLQRGRYTGYPWVQACSYLAWFLAERGEFDEGIVHGRAGLRIAEALDQPYSVSYACFGLGCLYLTRGDFGEAIRLLERALTLCRDWSIGFLTPFATWVLGYAYALSGRAAEGLTVLQQALTAYESKGRRSYRSFILVHLGEASLLADRTHEARSLAVRAVTLSRERGERGYEAHALRLLGEVAFWAEPPDDEAASHYQQALALTEELGMPPLMAHCHLGLGKLYRDARATARGPRSTSPPPRRCTARWTCGSGWSRRRRRCGS